MADSDSEKPLTAAELAIALDDLKSSILEQAKDIASREATRIADAKPPVSPGDWAWRTLLLLPRVFSSGLFFIALGAATLYAAYALGSGVHSAFTFVLVVLGVAVSLYGTGTQGMGRIETNTSAGKYHAAIAGGAGLLALAIAYGITHYAEEMKTAFQIEQRYVRIPVRASVLGNEVSNLYMWEFSVGGIGIPTLRRGDYLEVIVPYRQTDYARETKKQDAKGDGSANSQDAVGVELPDSARAERNCLKAVPPGTPKQFTRTIRATYELTSPNRNDPTKNNYVPRNSKIIPISIHADHVVYKDGALDFPEYPVPLCIDVQDTEQAKADSRTAAARELPIAEGKAPPKPSEPPPIPTSGSE
ncbi:MAG: hypothetical protein HZA66_05755 [Rhodopseudomonas palustris]|uniref:Uncharacterized protein n=1 Tax=Rhodopseudomonas palustris TaxID=1076 RepID=A0A933RVE7_RHOPL|nr:hypothetical protein [Rhodopseudomonas palustris]